jgi:hypothetical protein
MFQSGTHAAIIIAAFYMGRGHDNRVGWQRASAASGDRQAGSLHHKSAYYIITQRGGVPWIYLYGPTDGRMDGCTAPTAYFVRPWDRRRAFNTATADAGSVITK